jgi:DNA polymerase-3 subunit chi
MGEALFYHLTRSTLDSVVPMLVAKSMERGWKVVVRAREEGLLRWLDERLWLGPEEGFLPHGISGGPHDALQPVLLTAGAEVPAEGCLIAVGGAEVGPGECGAAARVCVVFDGNDASALDAARGQWKTLTTAGVAAQYWSEESGRWQKKAGG